MIKYIDAEKLIAEIKRLIDLKESRVANKRLNELLLFATSLQQEQPAVDLVAELKHHLATTPKEQLEKEWKELEPWGNIGPTVQEFLYGSQLEAEAARAELEKIIEQTYHDASVADTTNIEPEDYAYIARYFAEWGATHFNRKKEE